MLLQLGTYSPGILIHIKCSFVLGSLFFSSYRLETNFDAQRILEKNYEHHPTLDSVDTMEMPEGISSDSKERHGLQQII
jgi:hypothetical protein